MINSRDLIAGNIYYLVQRGDKYPEPIITTWEYTNTADNGQMYSFDDPSGLLKGKLMLNDQDLQNLFDRRKLDAELKKRG